MHPYRRGRASITRLRLQFDEIIETERLLRVAWRELIDIAIFESGKLQDESPDEECEDQSSDHERSDHTN